MKMKKLFASVLAAAVVCTTSGTVLANESTNRENIDNITGYSLLRYAHIMSLNPSITASGTIKASLTLYENLDYSLTLELQEYNGTWETIDSWSLNGTKRGTITESCSLESGKRYRAKAEVVIYDDNGRVLESTSKLSATVTAR